MAIRMSLIGRRVIVLETGSTAGNSGGALRAGYIRAASDQVYLNADISQIKVSGCVRFLSCLCACSSKHQEY